MIADLFHQLTLRYTWLAPPPRTSSLPVPAIKLRFRLRRVSTRLHLRRPASKRWGGQSTALPAASCSAASCDCTAQARLQAEAGAAEHPATASSSPRLITSSLPCCGVLKFEQQQHRACGIPVHHPRLRSYVKNGHMSQKCVFLHAADLPPHTHTAATKEREEGGAVALRWGIASQKITKNGFNL